MHSTIERQLKGRTSNLPADYVSLCKLGRKNHRPYEVSYLDYTFFKDFGKLNFVTYEIEFSSVTRLVCVFNVRGPSYTSRPIPIV